MSASYLGLNRQSKFEFFYKPYKWMNQINHMIPMQFDEDQKNTVSLVSGKHI